MWLPDFWPYWTIKAARTTTTTELASLATGLATAQAWHGAIAKRQLELQWLHRSSNADGDKVTWTCNELIMKGVRRQRHTGCMTMMMMAKFILLANMLSNAAFARERMVQEAAG